MLRTALILPAIGLLLSFQSLAQPLPSYSVYLDTDNDTLTGCSVTLAGSGVTLDGMESRLTAQVDGTLMVPNVTRETCAAGTFGSATSVGGGYPVGLNNGVSGGDVIELADALTGLGADPGTDVRLAFTADDGSGDDVMDQDGAAGPIILGIPAPAPAVPVPGLGLAGAAFLVILLGALAIVALRRRGPYWLIAGLVIAPVVWAANFMLDGLVGDWAGEPQLGSDIAADASNGNEGIDLLAGFAAEENDTLYFRMDVTELENNVPAADAVSLTVLEDSGATTVGLSGSDADGDMLTFNVATGPSLGSLGAITSTGATTADVDYTPNADANGADSFTYTATDGMATSAPATVSITITPVNDQPTFSASNPPAVLEDAGAQTVTGFATFDPGAANESGQAVMAYTVSNVSNAALFSAGPTVDAAGNLSYTPAADTSGTSTFDLTVQDDGGTANGGVDTSVAQTFTITVTSVNDPPSFTAGGNVSSDEDAGAQTVAGWASAIDPGAPEESTQTLSFNITNNSNAALFSAGPAINATTGDLTYTSALNANGSADITVELMDNGGTANGGVDTSAPATFTITVNPVNDPPMVTAPGPFAATGNVSIAVPDGVDDLLANANDNADGGTALTVTAASIASSNGGNVVTSADGTFSYDPPAGFEGADSFQYEVCDSGVPGSACTTATVTVNVSGMVWFIDPSAAPGGDGRLSAPFDTIPAFNAGAADEAGDNIFLYTGTHDGSLTLLANQDVFGQGATATLATMTSITPSTYSAAFPATNGTRPVIRAIDSVAVVLGSNNTLRGFNVGDTGNGTDIGGANFGTLTVSEVSLTGTGRALSLDTGTLADGAGIAPGFGSITSTSGANNIRLINVQGTPTLNGGALAGSSAQAFLVSGGTGSFSYSGTITNTSGRAVDIQNKTGGTVLLNGDITDSGQGVWLSNNGGSSILFGGTLTLSTGTSPAFTAMGGGTVVASGTGSTITTTTGTGVEINNTTIGAGGVTFRSVSVNGAANGIVLDTTGSSAFMVTGDGSTTAGMLNRNGSGGTIQNTTDDGVRLLNASNVTLRQLNIFDVGDTADSGDTLATTNDHAVESRGGSSIVLSAVHIRNPIGTGWEAFDISGNSRLDQNSRIEALDRTSNYNGLRLRLTDVSFGTFTVDNASFDHADPTPGDPATNGNAMVVLSTRGTAGGNFTISNSSFTGARGQALTLGIGDSAGSSGTVTTMIRGNNFQTAHPINGQNNLGISTQQSTTHFVTVDGNNFLDTGRGGSLSGQIIVQQAGAAQLDVLIQNNVIGGLATPNTSRQRGIDLLSLSTSTAAGSVNAEILGNRVYDVGRTGIYTSPRGQIGEFDLRVANNVIGRDPGGTVDPVGYDTILENAGIAYSVATDSSYSSTSQILLENNEVIAELTSGVRDGVINLILDPFLGGTVTANVTVRNNTLNNLGGLGDNFHALVRDSLSAPNNGVINLDLGNSGQNNAVGGSANYHLEIAAGNSGTLTVEDLPNVTTDNLSNGATPANVSTVGGVTSNGGNVPEPIL